MSYENELQQRINFLEQNETVLWEVLGIPDGSTIHDVVAAINKYKKFKEYTHKRMTDGDVPEVVPSPHTDAGCRIGGRFDYLFGQLADAQSEAATFRNACQSLMDADHHDHFAARMSDSEMAAINRIKFLLRTRSSPQENSP